MRLDTAKLLTEKIKNNFNQRYDFRDKKHNLENIILEDIREFGKYLSKRSKNFEFIIPKINIKRNDCTNLRKKIESIETEERKILKINKSTLWYQQRKIKEGKPVKL